MTNLQPFFDDADVQRMGWTLVHSLWQGVAAAALLAAALRWMRGVSANARYLAACAAMAALLVCAAATFCVVGRDAARPAITTSTPTGGAAAPLAPAPTANSIVQSSIDSSPTAPLPHDVLRWLVALWAIGVAAMALWHAAGWLWLRRLRGAPRSPRWQPILQRLQTRLGISRAVALLESTSLGVPAVIGVLRPVVLLPVGMLNDLSPQQVEALLAHELAHIRRQDYLVNLVQAAVETLLFYHPATWWISTQIRQERENCCDDLAAETCGDPALYIEALSALEASRSPRLLLSAGGGRLVDRVRRLLHLPPSRRTPLRSLAAAVLAVGCVGAALIGMTLQTSIKAALPALTSQPASAQAAYRIGPGDLLQITVDAPEKSGAITVRDVRVRDDGTINLGLYEMKVAGLTVTEVERAMEKVCREQQLIAEPRAKVEVSESRQRQLRRVFVRIVVTQNDMKFNGKSIDMDQLRKMLDDIPAAERSNTVLEVAVSPDATFRRFEEVFGQLPALAKEFGLAYLSDVGIDRSGNTATAPSAKGENDTRIQNALDYLKHVKENTPEADNRAPQP